MKNLSTIIYFFNMGILECGEGTRTETDAIIELCKLAEASKDQNAIDSAMNLALDKLDCEDNGIPEPTDLPTAIELLKRM